jgi:hypothetical protein
LLLQTMSSSRGGCNVAICPVAPRTVSTTTKSSLSHDLRASHSSRKTYREIYHGREREEKN